MTIEEVNQRLHKFNLKNDWSLFNDVPENMQVMVMYPSVMRGIGETDEQYRETLVQLFGPLEEPNAVA